MAKTLSFRQFAGYLVALGALAVRCSSEIDGRVDAGVDASGGAVGGHAGNSPSGAGGAGTGGMSGAAGATGAGAAGNVGVDAGRKEAGATGGSGGSTTGGAGASGRAGSTGASGRAGAAGAGNGGAAGRAGASGSGGAPGGNGGTGTAGSAIADGGSGDGGKTTGCGAPSWPASKTYTISVAGMPRTYILRLPDNYDTNHPYRLVVGYHWLNGTAENVANGGGATTKPFYGLWELANGSTIFVAPQGINNGWSDTGRTSTAGGQDIAFTRALLGELEKTLCIDATRIFAEGFSMGGSMSYAVACAMPDVFRAVAVHSGGPMSGCVQHSKPVPYFMTHGIQDGVCTYPGYGVPQLKDFSMLNSCTWPSSNTSTGLPNPTGAQGTHECVEFQGCASTYPVRACIFVGDHTPTSPNGSTNWVAGETWKFLSQF